MQESHNLLSQRLCITVKYQSPKKIYSTDLQSDSIILFAFFFILLIKDFLRGKDNAEDLKEVIQLTVDLVKKSYCLGQEHSKKNITIYKKEN